MAFRMRLYGRFLSSDNCVGHKRGAIELRCPRGCSYWCLGGCARREPGYAYTHSRQDGPPQIYRLSAVSVEHSWPYLRQGRGGELSGGSDGARTLMSDFKRRTVRCTRCSRSRTLSCMGWEPNATVLLPYRSDIIYSASPTAQIGLLYVCVGLYSLHGRLPLAYAIQLLDATRLPLARPGESALQCESATSGGRCAAPN